MLGELESPWLHSWANGPCDRSMWVGHNTYKTMEGVLNNLNRVAVPSKRIEAGRDILAHKSLIIGIPLS